MARQWTNMKRYERAIQEMRKQRKQRSEIAETLGLEMIQIKNFINRYSRRQKKGTISSRHGRPSSVTPQTKKQYEKRIDVMNYYVLFFTLLEGCEVGGKISGNTSKCTAISSDCHVPVF